MFVIYIYIYILINFGNNSAQNYRDPTVCRRNTVRRSLCGFLTFFRSVPVVLRVCERWDGDIGIRKFYGA